MPLRSWPTAEPAIDCPAATEVYVGPPSFATENEIVASLATYSPAKPNVSSRTLRRSPPPCQTTSLDHCSFVENNFSGSRKLVRTHSGPGSIRPREARSAPPSRPRLSDGDSYLNLKFARRTLP